MEIIRRPDMLRDNPYVDVSTVVRKFFFILSYLCGCTIKLLVTLVTESSVDTVNIYSNADGACVRSIDLEL